MKLQRELPNTLSTTLNKMEGIESQQFTRLTSCESSRGEEKAGWEERSLNGSGRAGRWEGREDESQSLRGTRDCDEDQFPELLGVLFNAQHSFEKG